MKYLKVKWIHSHPNEPVWLYSEMNDDRWETRKVEIYFDDTRGFASKSETFGTTKLSIEPLPSLEDIASDPQFVPEYITLADFEKIWTERKKGGDRRQI